MHNISADDYYYYCCFFIISFFITSLSISFTLIIYLKAALVSYLFPSCVQAHLRRHSQIHNRVENYTPRQRKLRNLIVEDVNTETTPTSTPPEGQDTAGEEAQPAAAENVDSGAVKEAVQESFGMDEVMEVLVTDTFPIQSEGLVVELPGNEADGKA